MERDAPLEHQVVSTHKAPVFVGATGDENRDQVAGRPSGTTQVFQCKHRYRDERPQV